MANPSYTSTLRESRELSPSASRRHSRRADAVQVAPYLTHVVKHHGQVTLIPPVNSGRIRKEKKKRPALRNGSHSGDSNFSLDVLRTSISGIDSPRPGSSNSLRDGLGTRNDSRGPSTSRSHLRSQEHSIPNFPPPSFEEAIASTHPPGTSLLVPSVAPRSVVERTPLGHVRVPSPIVPAFDRDAPVSSGADGDSDSDSSHSSLELIRDRDGHSQWEEDRTVGFSLEERVQREFERRRLAESLPRALPIHEEVVRRS
ncbi:hypothetical protein DFH11DRAFT_1056807 [Phellopilus nigrolimitatus]|nr:hypothetical protein DFH11DRAFT_1056807 [Phellopilus nigrolimitatus]